MQLETFQDVLTAIEKNKTRPFNLMVGNGFSMAYDPKIFSYYALHNFVDSLKDDTLTKLFGVVNTKNFELIMRQLETFSSFLAVLGTNPTLQKTVEVARSKLQSVLIDAVKELHPEHVFTVPEAASKACATFLKRFLDSRGKLFTSNYDLLLYWVLMRNQIPNANDGFGRDLLNPEEEGVPPEDQDWSELRWGNIETLKRSTISTEHCLCSTQVSKSRKKNTMRKTTCCRKSADGWTRETIPSL